MDDVWTRPFDRVPETLQPTQPALGSLEWDVRNAGGLLRILTVNMHGRPVDVAQSWMFGNLKIDSEEAAIKQQNGGMHLDCDDEWTLFNSQDRRMRAFFEWLDGLPPHVAPHILCFQEIMWGPMIDIAEVALKKRGWITLASISLDVDRGCRTCVPPRMGSGLGIYVRTSAALDVVEGDKLIFDHKLGADWLVEKGFKWALVRCRNKQLLGRHAVATKGEGYFVVITCHPQAYNQLYTEVAPGESWFVGFMRKLTRFDFDWRGGFPFAIANAHKKQYQQIADYVRDEILPRSLKRTNYLLGTFLAADLNVNRYAVTPESSEESCPNHAATPHLSREFAAVLKTGSCKAPKLLLEPVRELQPPNGGRFTWDASQNTIARPLIPSGSRSLAWIDSVMSCNFGVAPETLGTPVYVDNRALAMRLPKPIPEISPFWTSRCYSWRKQFANARTSYNMVNTEINKRLTLGFAQLRHLRSIFQLNPTPQATAAERVQRWKELVLGAPERLSSQLWKGAAHYGFMPNDLYVMRETKHLKIGLPHPFRMLSDVSDHHAVLARIIL
jgi:hypothetical protein